jgi:hypothetical protein
LFAPEQGADPFELGKGLEIESVGGGQAGDGLAPQFNTVQQPNAYGALFELRGAVPRDISAAGEKRDDLPRRCLPLFYWFYLPLLNGVDFDGAFPPVRIVFGYATLGSGRRLERVSVNRHARNHYLSLGQALQQLLVAGALHGFIHLSLQRWLDVMPADLANGQALAEMQTGRKEDRAQALVNGLVLVKLDCDLSSRKPGESWRALQNLGNLNNRHITSGLEPDSCDRADATDRAFKNKTGLVRKFLNRCRHASTSREDIFGTLNAFSPVPSDW